MPVIITFIGMHYFEFTIKIAKPFTDAVVQRIMDAGCLGVVEQGDSIIAYFPDSVDVKTIAADLSLLQALLEKSDQDHRLSFSYTVIPEQDWNETWKKGFNPIDIGERFTILPTWEEKRKDRINIVIDPAMAFGTGHHGTTRSCLILMERYADKNRNRSFLDLGTGTGILAIAAKHVGFHRVIAVDTDPLAIDAALLNIELNQAKGIEVREGSITGLNETYDFITANIILGVLVLLARAIAEHLKTGGTAILSGILTGQEDEVIAAMTQAGLTLLEQYHDDKWVSLVVTRS